MHSTGALSQVRGRSITRTHHNYTVLVGWTQGQLDLMRVTGQAGGPSGDTVNFMLSTTNDPDTGTFLNGAPDISFSSSYSKPRARPSSDQPDVLAPLNPANF